MTVFKKISVQEAQEIMDSGKVTIVDVRDAQSFSKGHIAHALIVNDENREVFVQEADRNKPLICYCYHGVSSQSAAAFFASQGFKDVYSIEGGYEQWKAVYG